MGFSQDFQKNLKKFFYPNIKAQNGLPGEKKAKIRPSRCLMQRGGGFSQK
jgi:hypothetical protein